MVTISLQHDHDEQDELNDDVNDGSHPEEGPTEAIVEWEDSVTEATGGSSVPRTDSTLGFSEQVLEDTQSVPRDTSGKSTPSHAKCRTSNVYTNSYKGRSVNTDRLSPRVLQG